MKKLTNILAISLLTFISFLLCSCKTEDNKYSEHVLYPFKSIDRFDSSRFFGQILDTDYANGLITFLEYESGNIYSLDTTLKLVRSINIGGEGPRELLDAHRLVIQNDTIFVTDRGHGRVVMLRLDGLLIDEIELNFHPTEDFVVLNNNVLIPSGGETDPFQKRSTTLGKSSSFGERKIFDNANDTWSHNNYIIAGTNENIVALNTAMPDLIIFDPISLEIKNRFELHHNLIATRTEDIQKRRRENTDGNIRQYIYFEDLQIKNGFAYTLVSTKNSENATVLENILVFDLETGKTISRIILKGDSDNDYMGVTTFALFDDKIVASNIAANKILLYQIK